MSEENPKKFYPSDIRSMPVLQSGDSLLVQQLRKLDKKLNKSKIDPESEVVLKDHCGGDAVDNDHGDVEKESVGDWVLLLPLLQVTL